MNRKKKEKPKAKIYPKKIKISKKKKEIKNKHIREIFELLDMSEDSKKDIKRASEGSPEKSSMEMESESDIKGDKKRKAKSIAVNRKPKKSQEKSSKEMESESDIKRDKKRKPKNKEIKRKSKKSQEKCSREMEFESDIKGDKKTDLFNKKKNQNLKKYYENSNSELDSEKEIKEKKQSTGLINISKYSEEHRSSSDYTDDSLESLFAALELDSKENDIKKSNKNRLTDEEEQDNKLPKDKGI